MSKSTHNGYYHWILYYNNSDEELAMCMRSTHEENEISQIVLRRLLNEMAREGLIRDELPLVRHIDRDYWEGWDLSLAFDLCPCVQIWCNKFHRKDDSTQKTKWHWKKIT